MHNASSELLRAPPRMGFNVLEGEDYDLDAHYYYWIYDGLIFAVFLVFLYALYGLRRERSTTVSYRRLDRKCKGADRVSSAAVSVLVTGGNGVLGKSLIKILLNEGGYKIHSLDLWIPSEGDRNPEVSYIQADVTNLDDMAAALQGVDAAFHTAGLIPSVKYSSADYYRVNAKGTATVIEACKRSGVKRLIYTSTVFVISSEDPNQDLSEMDETAPYPEKPLNAYTGSKAAAEKLVLEASGETGLVTCALRPGGLLSAENPYVKSLLKDVAPYVGDGRIISNTFLVPVDSVAKAHILAEQKLRQEQRIAAGKAYNLCLDDEIVYRDFVGYEPDPGAKSCWGFTSAYSLPFWVISLILKLNRIICVCTGKCILGTYATPLLLSFLIHPKQVFISARAHKVLGWEKLPPWREILTAFIKEHRAKN